VCVTAEAVLMGWEEHTKPDTELLSNAAYIQIYRLKYRRNEDGTLSFA